MKLIKLHTIGMMFAAGLVSTASFAQDRNTSTVDGTRLLGPTSDYRTWSVGVNAGVFNQSNIFGFNQGGFDKLSTTLGYSAYIKKQISPSFGIIAQYMGGTVEGQSTDADNSSVINQEFSTKMPWSAALSGEWTMANTDWRFFNSFIKPYMAVDVGAMNFETTTKQHGGTPSETTFDSKTKLYVPVDAGFKFAVAKG